MALRLGVVGYGVGGRFFHTPLIEAAEVDTTAATAVSGATH